MDDEYYFEIKIKHKSNGIHSYFTMDIQNILKLDKKDTYIIDKIAEVLREYNKIAIEEA